MNNNTVSHEKLLKNGKTYLFQAGNLISQAYRIYVPHHRNANSNILVCVHGISRRSKEQIRYLRTEANKHNTIIIAPHFSNRYHPSYQRHEIGTDGFRSDQVLNNILADAEQRLLIQIDHFNLFGFSGGAQFAHRYALRYPGKVSKLICCAAGWYTFPDADRPFPYGLAQKDSHFILDDISEHLREFFDISLIVAVGEHDKHPDTGLNRSNKVNMQQGFNRVERAARWTKALIETSEHLGKQAKIKFVLLPKSGHSFSECIKYGMLSAFIF